MTPNMTPTMTPSTTPTMMDTNNHNNMLAVVGDIPSARESCSDGEFDWHGQCTQMSETLSLPCLSSSQLTVDFPTMKVTTACTIFLSLLTSSSAWVSTAQTNNRKTSSAIFSTEAAPPSSTHTLDGEKYLRLDETASKLCLGQGQGLPNEDQWRHPAP
jgi:hypothetical protein